MFELEEINKNTANIKVVGVGGAGGNALNTMISSNLNKVDFIAVNTDLQALETSLSPIKVQIGEMITRGLGAGSDPAIGREAATENREIIKDALEGADMVFITCGMGGGTGTGAAPVIAEVSKEVGALTVAVVTKPFFYEGKKRTKNALLGINELYKFVDTIIVIPNDRIQLVVEKGTPLITSFAVANDVLKHAVQGISDLILKPGLINLDFADVRTIMNNSGKAVMGIGSGSGENGAGEAAKKAISNPLLEDASMDGVKGIIVNITGGIDITLDAIREATELIHDSAHEDADIIFGTVIEPDCNDEIKVTVIATGFEKKSEKVETSKLEMWKNESIKEYRRGSEKILSKSLSDFIKSEEKPHETEAMTYEESVDIPTFSRSQQ